MIFNTRIKWTAIEKQKEVNPVQDFCGQIKVYYSSGSIIKHELCIKHSGPSSNRFGLAKNEMLIIIILLPKRVHKFKISFEFGPFVKFFC